MNIDMKKYDLTEKDIEDELKWLEKPNTTLNDYGDIVRYLLNEVEELKLKNKNKIMKKTIAQQLNVEHFPFIIKDANGNEIYTEDADGFWIKTEWDPNGNGYTITNPYGYWEKSEFDSNGDRIYWENSKGIIEDNRNVPEEKSNNRVIYGENLNGDRYKMEIDSEGNQIIQKVESPEETTKARILNLINEYLIQNGITNLHTIDEIGDLYGDVFDFDLDIRFQYPDIIIDSNMRVNINGKLINE